MLFADEAKPQDRNKNCASSPWRVLIVDDEPEIHQITRLILGNVVFDSRPLEFLSAYSGHEALEVMSQESDIAIILLDVVMETVHAGLDIVKKIREQQNNKIVRIILRTGQPGDAPSNEVILNYDINDYKEKSELTYDKLFTSVVAALRTYQQLIAIEKCRNGLKKIIEATAQYCKCRSKEEFAQQLLIQISSLLNLGDNSLYVVAANHVSDSFSIVAGRGIFSSLSGEYLAKENNPQYAELNILIQQTLNHKKSQVSEDLSAFYFESPEIGEHVILIQKEIFLAEEDLQLLELFINNTLSAFNNLMKRVHAEHD